MKNQHPLSSVVPPRSVTRTYWRLPRWWFVALACTLASVLLAAPASACGPATPSGDPNKQCANVGNPINVMTGNKYQREEDLPALPGVLGLELVRHYNSAFSAPDYPNGPLGRGWRLSYETEIVDIYGKVQVLEPDGGRIIFDRDPKSPTGCTTPDPANGTMTLGRQLDGKLDYTWTHIDGRKLHFNGAGKLDQIKVPTGEVVHLLYDSKSVLVRVIDPQGRSLNLSYYDSKVPNQFHGIQYIDTPVGRFAYEYGSALPKGAGLFDQRTLLANLVRVRLPDQFDPDKKVHSFSSRGTTRSTTSRIYHHEDPRSPWLMTGISVESIGSDGKAVKTRYATFGYDDTGRATLSTHAGNVDKVTLDNQSAGKTVLTNSLGQKTVYRYAVVAGEYRLLGVRGVACALCGEPNVRYRYDDAGRVAETTKLSENGEPVATVKTERDKLGRVTRASKVVYEHGKPGTAQLQLRFEYLGDSFAPALVARPSVVLGRELVTRIDYNEAGQPLTVSEAGWSPAIDGKQAVVRIERTTHYRYAVINGHSVLTEIDGPLPNGKTDTPLDSDITRIEYDHQSKVMTSHKSPLGRNRLARFDSSQQQDGIVTAIILPGNHRSEIEYDSAGRIVTVKDTEGHTTTLRYNPRGKLVAATQQGLTYSTLYDAFDHPIESGYSDGARYRALVRFGYDDAGRNTWTASAIGIARTKRFDTEDALLEQITLSSTIKRTQRYEYDDRGRLQALTDAAGGTRRITWNARGLPDALTDALGRTTHFGFDAAGNITTVTDVTNAATHFELDGYGRTTAVVAPNGATTRYFRDDFGRIVATIGADSGKTTRTFDAVDRLIASTDANGNRASYEYDVMGRIISQRVTDAANSGKATVTTWRYEGQRLIAVEHPNQAERYSYDAQGRVSAKTVILTLVGGEHVTYTTRYVYDSLGQPAGISLPDGSNLDYRRNGQNQITAVTRSPAASSWLRSLLPRQTIVRDLERDLVGLKRLTYGNGIEAYYQRSNNGSLARIMHRASRIPVSGPDGIGVPEVLLGVHPALATPAPALPGALGLPFDQKALLDHRYLWDLQGNLLYTQDKGTASSYAYDMRDRLIGAATATTPEVARVAAGPSTRFARYFYDGNGNRLLAQEGLSDQSDFRGNTIKTAYAPGADRWQADAGYASPSVGYDATGQPKRIDNRSFVWDAFGKLLEVRVGQRILARYRYNHRGERIEKIAEGEHTYYLYEDRKLVAELDGKGTVRRQYVYLNDQPVATIDTTREGTEEALPPVFTADIASIWRAWFGKGESTVYLHSNHLGATEMATDANGKPIWQAAYSPFGKLVSTGARGKHGFDLNLRLPGQYADNETGLYYNDHRYYDPARGRYLTPDPLGLRGGANGYVYAGNNPLRYIDPKGLVLFAFDGTSNTDDQAWLIAHGSSSSNVLQFAALYMDGRANYISGVGTLKRDPTYGDIAPAAYVPGGALLPTAKAETADSAFNYSGPARMQRMLQYFNDQADLALDTDTMEVDIIGFSRGAAEARDFANTITASTTNGWYSYKNAGGQQVCQKVDFRFMGLFDAVLSTNRSGTDYKLSIPAQFAYVAQAVALNEHRGNSARTLHDSWGAFPLESIIGATVQPGQTRIERGFLGSHADIGGGFGARESQLAQVALSWMVSQASTAGVSMRDSPLLHEIISNPVIHDKSDNQYSTSPSGAPIAPGIEDRAVHYMNGKATTQMAMTGAGMTWSDTQQFISYLHAVGPLDKGQYVFPLRADYVKGTVNMQSYLAWLNQHGYNIDMKVQ